MPGLYYTSSSYIILFHFSRWNYYVIYFSLVEKTYEKIGVEKLKKKKQCMGNKFCKFIFINIFYPGFLTRFLCKFQLWCWVFCWCTTIYQNIIKIMHTCFLYSAYTFLLFFASMQEHYKLYNKQGKHFWR